MVYIIVYIKRVHQSNNYKMTLMISCNTPKQHEPGRDKTQTGEHQRETKDTKEKQAETKQTDDNLDKSVERKREYYKLYYLMNKDKIKDYANEWNNNNKERRLETQRLYRIKQKARILANANKRILCECCQCKYTKSNKSKHIRSAKHKRNFDKFNIHNNITACPVS